MLIYHCNYTQNLKSIKAKILPDENCKSIPDIKYIPLNFDSLYIFAEIILKKVAK